MSPVVEVIVVYKLYFYHISRSVPNDRGPVDDVEKSVLKVGSEATLSTWQTMLP